MRNIYQTIYRWAGAASACYLCDLWNSICDFMDGSMPFIP